MNVAIFGASSGTGRHLVAAASAAGVGMRLHYRASTEEPPVAGSISVIGSLTDPVAVRSVLRDTDAVIILFGPRAKTNDQFSARATRAIVENMRRLEQQRLICVTCAMSGNLASNVSLGMRFASRVRKFTGEYETDDRDAQERAVRASKLEWTIVKPAKLTDDGGGESVQHGPDVDIGLRSSVSREGLARFLLGELVEPRWTGQTVFVASSRQGA